MQVSGRVWVDERAAREIERGALHVYSQHVERAEAHRGDWVEIIHRNETLGYGLYNPLSSIPVKLFTKEERTLEDYVAERLEQVWKAKTRRYKNVLRWIFAEGDRIPGLIVDVFGEVASVRISVLGLEKALNVLKDALEDRGVEHAYVRIEGRGARAEGMKRASFFLFGSKGTTKIEEYGALFHVDVVRGQKTGFYLDQRENRAELSKWVEKGDKVLDAFAYTGGFGIHASLKGAHVTFVELGKNNAQMIKKNMKLNGVEGKVVIGDAVRFMKTARDVYDVVIVDPPALAKGRDKGKALRMYMEINRAAMRLLDGGILVSCSCSHPITPKDFLGVLRAAATKEKKELTLLGGVRGQAPDHTVYLPQPETKYLKCVFGVVE